MSGEKYVADRDARIRIRREMFLALGEQRLAGYTVDLSIHGFSAIVSHPLNEGDRVVVGLFLDLEKTETVVVEGEVTWTEPATGEPALKNKLGIRFTGFREGDEHALHQFLRSKGVEVSFRI